MKRMECDPAQWMGVGLDDSGRLLEYVAVEDGNDTWHIFHCCVVTEAAMIEVGLKPRGKKRKR
ncbi:MAG: hypothetical protein LBH13_10105 [Cellulomonadaceae bacterium]|nr:hypothetical protein [Cellulomonadaceae bacterium]